ncbi:MAG: hypothetical protein ACRD1S_15050 [Vicinamibacterales bacterium]
MDAGRAAQQIAEIHRQIAKGEIYRGWRAAPVALSGVIGLVAAWLQRPTLGADDPIAFVIYWTAVAGAAAAAGASEIVYAGLRSPRSRVNGSALQTSFERRQTRRVAVQFLPPLVVAALVTATFVRLGAALVALMPGLWALFFGIAIFAARPYLPRASGWVALYYVGWGSFLLWNAHMPVARSPWAVGGVFGVGQLFAAAVIYWNLERRA